MVADDVSDEPPPPDKYRQYRPHPTDPNKWITILNVYPNVLRADLDSADHYLQLFTEPPAEPETVPGTTAVGTSARVLKALKAGSNTDFTVYLTVYDAYPLTSADANAGGPFYTRFKGTLHRVGSSAVGVPVIVKGRLVNLPAIHVKGTLLDLDAEFWFLDDVDNPTRQALRRQGATMAVGQRWRAFQTDGARMGSTLQNFRQCNRADPKLRFFVPLQPREG